MVSISRDGLAWEESGYDIKTVWTREPSLAAITNVCREKLQIDGPEAYDVSFYAAGAFNKLYLVQTSQRQLLMRTSLPFTREAKPGVKSRRYGFCVERQILQYPK
jgi:hypothetical protein